MSSGRPLRGSFQQLLLLAFLLIAALLGGIALRAVFTLDQLMRQSGGFAQRALELNAAAQSLSERSAGMERAARQSLIFNDAALRRRFDDMARDARGVLERLEAPAGQVQGWRTHESAIRALLSGPSDSALERERSVAAEFRELDQIIAAIAQQVQGAIEARNQTLTATLEASRARLTRQVVGTIALALVLAIAFGVWLARPFKRLERAIVGLGQNRLDEPIDIRGPSDVRRVAQQLEWLRLRLTELDADKSRFLRHVSHELKTPLAAMREGVALLQDEVAGALSADQREVARILHQNTVLLQNHIEALLGFNAAAFDARQLQRSQTDLLQLLEEQIDVQRLQWQGAGLQVQLTGASVVLPVDAAKLAIVFGNLLANAIRFSPRGGTIGVHLLQEGDRVHIDIGDQGPGVAGGDRDRIFEPFYRGERQPPHAERGTGIGLSIVQEYIAAHGGRTTLLPDDPEQPGARFRIELPHVS